MASATEGKQEGGSHGEPFNKISDNIASKISRARSARRKRREYVSTEMSSFFKNPKTSFYRKLLLVFIPHSELTDRRLDDLYDTCAAAFCRYLYLTPYLLLEDPSLNKPLFPCYLEAVEQIVPWIKRDSDMASCTFESLIEQLRAKNLLNMSPASHSGLIAIGMHIWVVVENMTLLLREYNLLGSRISGNSVQEDLGLANGHLEKFQRLGLFEDNALNAPRSISTGLRDELLNVNFLCNVLGIETCWVMNLGEHLKLDEPRRQLKLFRLPSFCEINVVSSNSFLVSALSFLNSSKTQQQGLVHGVTLLSEVCHSYNLIFQGDPRSRRHFCRVEKPKLERDRGILDPVLHKICCQQIPPGGYQSLAGPKHDFYAFARRLTILQNFAETALPKRRRSLWNDRRNLEKYYTFKAVVIFGSLGVVIGLIQIVLSGMQVAYAIKPTAKS